MVLVDMNQVTLSSLMVQIGRDSEVNADLVRHMVLNSIRMYRTKFVEDYGELVLCYDSKHYWRKDFFPQYKSNRKKMREASDFDWKTIFDTLNILKEELKENFPYKILEVYGAEADDIIATICESEEEDIMIISGDKDFIQLQKYKNVKQWNPVQKKLLNGKNPELYLKEHIIKGDRSDGIPNVLSGDNSFVDKIRQIPLTKKKIRTWIEHDFMDVAPNEEAKRNYHRNTTLVDLSNIPQDLKDKIKESYKTTPIIGERKNLINYFINNKLKELTNNLGDF
jgi:5'-3' exonuclease